MKGTVKFFNDMKGFGFIVGEDGKEYFVHQTGIQPGVMLKENDPVSFDVEQGDRGPKAVNVGRDEGGVEAPAEEEPAEEATEEAPEEEAPEADEAEEPEEKPQE